MTNPVPVTRIGLVRKPVTYTVEIDKSGFYLVVAHMSFPSDKRPAVLSVLKGDLPVHQIIAPSRWEMPLNISVVVKVSRGDKLVAAGQLYTRPTWLQRLLLRFHIDLKIMEAKPCPIHAALFVNYMAPPKTLEKN